MVESGVPGRFYAVELRGVVAESVKHLVPGADKATIATMATQRCIRALEITRARRKFGG